MALKRNLICVPRFVFRVSCFVFRVPCSTFRVLKFERFVVQEKSPSHLLIDA